MQKNLAWRALVVVAAFPAASIAACSAFGAATDAIAPDADTVWPSDAGVEAPIAPSCRGIKEKVPAAPSGSYALVGRDGGFYCDMESFDGGWTLVRPDMVREGKTQDVDPDSVNTLDVRRTADPRGGARWVVTVTGDDCNAGGRARARHWALIDEVDAWQQIMATYTFRESVNCWNIFGNTENDSPALPDMNVRIFDPAIDVADRQQNMARTTNGVAIPYDGKTNYCGAGIENFWRADYRAQTRRARVVLRRVLQGKAAGLSVATSCGRPTWELGDVFVR